ncbi:hypothetical protein PS3A_22460 [Pseudomonas sp. 3A(2025)]
MMIDMKISGTSLVDKFLAQTAAQQEKDRLTSTPLSSDTVIPGEVNKIAPASRQLSEALQRAEQRDKKLDRPALSAYAKTALDQITGPHYHALKSQHNAELPNTKNPDILARAKQATDYENGKAPNPFKGMSAELLTAISYDDSGTFTVNERRAAWSESYDQHQAWGLKVIAEATEEYNRTGRHTKIYGQVLERYKSQPLIEKAQFPENYEKDLIAKRDEALRLAGKQAPKSKPSTFDMIREWRAKQPRLTTLFSMLAGVSPDMNERLPSSRSAKFTNFRPLATHNEHPFIKVPTPLPNTQTSAALFKDLSKPNAP